MNLQSKKQDMGQYYKGCILEKDFEHGATNPVVAAFYTWDVNEGLKLMEHSWVGSNYVKLYENMLAGIYYGHPLIWAGDYGEKEWNGESFYELGGDVLDRTKTAYMRGGELRKECLCDKEARYILNLDKKLYAPIPKCEKGAVHPLPILCSDGGGGSGCGDYNGSNMELVGTWALDCIGIADEVPDGFTLVQYDRVEGEDDDLIFNEEW